jgi:hypothetical protein
MTGDLADADFGSTDFGRSKRQRPDCLRPLSRNTAQGASRIQDVNGIDLGYEVSARYDVFVIFFFGFFFVGVVAMT